ncbi:PAP2-domain-containing protein [Trametes coccinea BRFM310]|uniref:PAP2-domain-containing protein n=1 Tax=Trametes coccinea (strain BRFM310) TaxID=1353009 RepID=A0A1Y2IK93_TRAC3|nr:PAP2-domain-containing protein [Trametes coccinea BRFM310]
MSWWLLALDQTNVIVTTLTACVLLYTRSVGVAYFVVGAVLCSVTVKILKRCFRQPRPVTVIVNGRRRKKSYGMPSTHSAVITFFATYITLASAFLPIHPSFPSSPALTRGLPPLVVVPLASTIAASRIWLRHHTWPQVAAGCAYGLVAAPLWFILWTKGLNMYGRQAEALVMSHVPF